MSFGLKSTASGPNSTRILLVGYLTNNWIFKSTARTAMEGFGEIFGLNSRLTWDNRVTIPYLLEIFEQFKLFLELEIHVLVLSYSV
jgi:hypothetical protein